MGTNGKEEAETEVNWVSLLPVWRGGEADDEAGDWVPPWGHETLRDDVSLVFPEAVYWI